LADRLIQTAVVLNGTPKSFLHGVDHGLNLHLQHEWQVRRLQPECLSRVYAPQIRIAEQPDCLFLTDKPTIKEDNCRITGMPGKGVQFLRQYPRKTKCTVKSLYFTAKLFVSTVKNANFVFQHGIQARYGLSTEDNQNGVGTGSATRCYGWIHRILVQTAIGILTGLCLIELKRENSNNSPGQNRPAGEPRSSHGKHVRKERSTKVQGPHETWEGTAVTEGN